jgi:hypothetical protein
VRKKMLRIPATISKIETMSDKGLRVRVDTQELTPEDSAEVMRLKDAFGYFVFSEEIGDITEKFLKELPKLQRETGVKTPSQRIRAILFVYWKEKKVVEPFESFYNRKIEEYINLIKEKLNGL